jgi:hypothetical protein
MALNDLQHVEAVAILRSIQDAHDQELVRLPPDLVAAVDVWLRENHPAPHTYMAAMSQSVASEGKDA